MRGGEQAAPRPQRIIEVTGRVGATTCGCDPGVRVQTLALAGLTDAAYTPGLSMYFGRVDIVRKEWSQNVLLACRQDRAPGRNYKLMFC